MLDFSPSVVESCGSICSDTVPGCTVSVLPFVPMYAEKSNCVNPMVNRKRSINVLFLGSHGANTFVLVEKSLITDPPLGLL